MFTLVGPQGFTRQPLPFRPVKTHAFPAPCKPKASAKTSIPTCSPSSLPWEDPPCEAWETEKYTPYNNYHTYFFLIWPLTCCLSASSGIFSILLSNRISEWTRTFYTGIFLTCVPLGQKGFLDLLFMVRFLESKWFVWVTQMNLSPSTLITMGKKHFTCDLASKNNDHNVVLSNISEKAKIRLLKVTIN